MCLQAVVLCLVDLIERHCCIFHADLFYFAAFILRFCTLIFIAILVFV